jgi:hypothetical protein
MHAEVQRGGTFLSVNSVGLSADEFDAIAATLREVH